jgi:hypothetical protein
MTTTPPLFELAPMPEPETVHLVLVNENGRLDPADDDDDEEPPVMTRSRIICLAAACPVYRWRPGTRQVLVQLRPLALHRPRPRPCPVHRFPRWRPC